MPSFNPSHHHLEQFLYSQSLNNVLPIQGRGSLELPVHSFLYPCEIFQWNNLIYLTIEVSLPFFLYEISNEMKNG